jgi:uncharacterized protein (TIGR00299 family) protein
MSGGDSGLRIGYFDCFAGASGDMILASLFDAGLEEQTLGHVLADLGLEGMRLEIKSVLKNGVRAKSFAFRSTAGPRDEESGTFRAIAAMIEASGLTPHVKTRAIRAFDSLAEAEARIHGTAKADVHFHEVGSLDSIVDVVGSVAGIDALGIERVVSSPLALGAGVVRCEHGTLPSPAPATLEIARGLPVRGWALDGEMTTPTGAAILKACASSFGPLPEMVVSRVGYGAGSRNLEGMPNVLRLIVGDSVEEPEAQLEHDRVSIIETNIDDLNPQFFSHVMDDLFALGALDVWVDNILMKKGRPGFLLGVLAPGERVRALSEAVMLETTSSGVRISEVGRLKLPRRSVEVETRLGKIRAKVFRTKSGERCAPEYEDCLRVSRATGRPVAEVMEEVRRGFGLDGPDAG